MAAVRGVECGSCAGSVRVQHGIFFHDISSPHARIATPARVVRCTFRSHKDCEVTIEAGEVQHSGRRSR